MAKQFGIITTTSGLSGIVVNSLDKSQNAEIAEARDSAGKVIEMKAYSVNNSINCTGIVDSSVSVSAGASISLDGKTYIIESVSQKETNTGFVEVTVSAKSADSATITAISSGTTA